MALTQKNQLLIAYKKLVGKAHTNSTFGDPNEALGSGVQLDNATIFADPIPPSPNTALWSITDNIVEKVEFELVPIALSQYTAVGSTAGGIQDDGDGAPSLGTFSNGIHAYKLKLPSDYEVNSSNTKAGTAPFISNTLLPESNGAIQIIPPKYGSLYPVQISSSAGIINALDEENCYLDTFAGVLFVQDVNRVPTKVTGYIYIGKYQKDVVTNPAGSTGYLQYNNNGVFDASSNLFWDLANNRLGIGTTSPNYTLAVTGTLGVSGTATFAGTVNAATFVGNLTNAITFNNGGAGVASGTTFNNSAARTISYNTIGAPSTTGTGASGTWNITASNANLLDNLDSTSFVRSDADDTISGDLNTTAAISYTQGIGVRVLQPEGGLFTTGTATLTGYIKITLPVSWTHTMMMFDVDIYDYGGDTDGESFKIQVGGYNPTPNWVNVFANILTGRTDRFFNVRFGHDGSNCAIYIGESTSTWNYPQISVSNFFGGYSTGATAANWADGWSIEITTTLGTITKTKTLENVASEALTAGTTTGTSTLRGPTSGFLLTPSDDTDTGLYDSGTDTLGFYTANTEKMRITSAGNVGIGITDPGIHKLNVNGAIRTTGIYGNTYGATATAYTYTAPNLFWRWTKIANMGNSGILIFDVNAKTDSNYPTIGSARISVSSHNNTTVSANVATLGNSDIYIAIAVDTSRDVWLYAECSWISSLRWQILHNQDSTVYESGFTQYTPSAAGTGGRTDRPPNSMSITYGQTLRSTDYTNITTNAVISNNIFATGDLAVNGGDITTTATTFNLLNTTATTVNFAGASTALNIGATTGTTTIKNNLDVVGTIQADKITAREYHTELVSASIIYQSGSTKFGDTPGGVDQDIHQFSGSLLITGSEVRLTGGSLSVTGEITATNYIGIRESMILPNFALTAFSFTANGGTVEVGVAKASISFSATANRTPTTVALTDNYGTPSQNLTSTWTSPNTSAAFSSTGPSGAGFVRNNTNESVTFTLTAAEGGIQSVKTLGTTWTRYFYWGRSSNASLALTEASVKALPAAGGDKQLNTSKARTFTVSSMSNEYAYFAYPTSYGAITQLKDNNAGFPTGFTLVGTVTTVTTENGSGNSTSYYLYRTTNALNGTISFTTS